MKALLVLFIIYFNYVICENNKYAVKSFPKKVRPYGNGKILINSGKYVHKPKVRTTTKPSKRAYTVFQVVGNAKTIQGVPDSPYFPVDQSYDHKPRVKKVLPDYTWASLRNKRSAVLEESAIKKEEEKKVEKKTDTTPELIPEKKEDAKVEKKSALSLEKKTNKTETHQESQTTKKEEKEPDKPIERAGAKKTTKAVRKATPKAVKKGDIKRERKSETKTTVKDNPKPDTNVESKRDKKDDSKKAPGGSSKTDTMLESKNLTTLGKSADLTATEVNNEAKGKETSTSVAKAKSRKSNVTSKVQQRAGKRKSSKNKPKQRKGAKTKSKQPAKGHKNQARSKKSKKSEKSKGSRTGKKLKAQRRLIAGREALIEDYPYVVSIQKNDQHWCSGALLNPRLVITTANCLWKANRISRMEVRAGSRHANSGGQLAGIQEVMRHPAWGLRKNPDNDVALMLLDRNIRFSDSCHGVDLPNRVMMPPFDDAWVTSWGAERRDGIYDTESNALQVFHTRLMDRAKCNNITTRFSVIVTENFICLSQHGQTAPCTRDTGAPAVSDGILWGLASWGIRKLCGTERFPAMFSYLASHGNLDFITNATKSLMSDKRHYPFGDRYPLPHPPSSKSASSER